MLSVNDFSGWYNDYFNGLTIQIGLHFIDNVSTKYKQGFCLLSPSRQGQVTEQGWRMLKLVALLYLAVLLGCTALINFSLGFIVALSLVPITAFITPHTPK